MKNFIKTNAKEIMMISIIIIIQTIVFTIAGFNKQYIHMDEAFSMGLTNYHVINLKDDENFYNEWHDKNYYKDYLVVNENEKFNFLPVYINQKNDVHPPLYYLLLRIGMNFHINKFSVWSGIILNIIIYVFIVIFMYLIIKKLLEGKIKYKEKSAVLALMTSLLVSSVNNAIYIRMYALSTLNIAITTYLHLKLLDTKNSNKKLLICIGLSALAGSLTHYYYLFYLFTLFIMFAIKYIKEKEYKEFGKYFLSLSIAGLCSIAIFPFSIKHLFFGYRGQGAISKLENISKFANGLIQYILKLNLYTFSNMIFLFLIIFLLIIIYKKIKKTPIIQEKNKYIKYIIIPTIVYFVLVAISSPWIELRYIAPVCAMIFVIFMFYLEELLNNILNEKSLNIAFIIVFLGFLVMPFVLNIRPQEMYWYKKNIVQKFENELLDVPTIYLANSKSVRFLDDILLFMKIDDSYIAEGTEINEKYIQSIFENKDISKGIVVFANYKTENDKMVEIVKKAMNLNHVKHLQRMNACDIYYIK